MRVLFMGTSNFAVPSLKALINSKHDVVGVVTQPDRPAGRKRELRASPIKEIAIEANLPILQPKKVRSEDFIEEVRKINPDVIIVAAFGQIIPQAVLDIPKYGCINVHASLLPKYRGAAPVHYALFNGEKNTGITIMQMDAGLDTGPILLQEEVEILPDDNQGALETRLSECGADLLMRVLDKIETEEINPIPQDDSNASYAPSIKKEECRIDWKEDAQKIANKVRGCSPRPGAYAYFNGSPLKIWSCYAMRNKLEGAFGEITGFDDAGIIVQTGQGMVVLTEVQPENKKRMHASEFARGYRIAQGMKLN